MLLVVSWELGMTRLFLLRKPGHLRLFESLISVSDDGHSTVFFTQNKFSSKDLEFLAEFKGKYPKIEFVIWGKDPNMIETFCEYIYSQLYLFHYSQKVFANYPYLRNRAFKEVSSYYPLSSQFSFFIGNFEKVRIFLTKCALNIVTSFSRYINSNIEIEKISPSVIVVTPLIELWSRQNSWIVNARSRNIPTIYAVHSWDNLTTKGPYCVQADEILLWNVGQIVELEKYHHNVNTSVRVTGSFGYDKWFERYSLNEKKKCETNLELHAPNIKSLLFLGSSRSISGKNEINLLTEIARAIRPSGWQVVYRMHPQNPLPEDFQTSDFVVYPKTPQLPVFEGAIATFRESVALADAVVGINTSAMFEALILGKPVINLNLSNFKQGQDDTIHYKHILSSEAILKVYSVSELVDLLGNLEKYNHQAARLGFLTKFIRPQGLAINSTDYALTIINEVADKFSNRELKPSNKVLLPLRIFQSLLLATPAIPFFLLDIFLTREVRKRRRLKHGNAKSEA